MANDKGTALPRSAIFEGISDDTVTRLCSRGRTVSYESGRVLFERGQEAAELMVLQDGVVELLFPITILGVTRDVTMESQRPGAVVAWSAVVSPYYLTLSARCANDCTLVSFARDTLNEFFESDPRTGYRFMANLARVIGRRLQAMQTIWMREVQASAAARLG